MRLNKYLSGAGICSRREADRFIESGCVTVDGKRAKPGMQVTEENDIRVGKKKVKGSSERVVLAVNKPVGIVCTEDMREKHNIIRFLDYPVRVTYAGRLDKESEGLLIMTNDGDLINAMMRARYCHEKEYKVTVNKPVTDEFIRRMQEGIRITDKEKKLDVVTFPCRVQKLGKYTFSIVLTQGINRQIRRMCMALGYKVTKLIRIRIVNIKLGSLKSGEMRKLTKQELKELYEQTKSGQDEGTCQSS
ncbi:MAG: pseudouridine synthase [Dorea sp.]|jgi:23S rRNA pseudouridine2604 synthase|nr:pseudouridine synthase [Dorea sp.]